MCMGTAKQSKLNWPEQRKNTVLLHFKIPKQPKEQKGHCLTCLRLNGEVLSKSLLEIAAIELTVLNYRDLLWLFLYVVTCFVVLFS